MSNKMNNSLPLGDGPIEDINALNEEQLNAIISSEIVDAEYQRMIDEHLDNRGYTKANLSFYDFITVFGIEKGYLQPDVDSIEELEYKVDKDYAIAEDINLAVQLSYEQSNEELPW